MHDTKLNIHQKQLVLIQSQPGYGKTKLLGTLCKDSKKNNISLFISESDNNPVELLKKIVSSLQALKLGVNTAFINQLDNIALPSLEPIINSMLDSCLVSKVHYIFVDDIDLLTNESSNKIISSFIAKPDDPFHLIVTCTKSPNFSYSNLLLHNQVGMIGETYLKLPFCDVRNLFDMQGFTQIESYKLEELLNITDGWPLGIQFVLNHIKNADEMDLILEDLKQGNQSLATYFSEKSYHKQTDDYKKFIHEISVVDEFHLSLCNDITQDQNAHTKLSYLLEDNTFITTLADDHYKFHSLFLKFLRNKARLALGPFGILECSIRAANWLYNNDRTTKAIELALKVGQFEIASGWIVNELDIFLKKGHHYDYIEWVDKLPLTFLDKYPLIRSNYMLVLCFTKQFDKMNENSLILLSQLADVDENSAEIIKRQTSLASFIMSGLIDDIKGLNSKITHWLDEWGQREVYQTNNQYHFELAMAYLVKGFSCKCISLFDEGKKSLFSALEHFKSAESYFGVGWTTAILSVLYAKQGFHHEAFQEATDSLKEVTNKLGKQSHLGYMLSTLIAAMNYEFGELELAQEYIESCQPYIKEQGSTDILIALFQTESKIFVAKGLLDEGLNVLKNAIKWSENNNYFRLKLTLVDDLITLLLLNNRIKEADNYAQTYQIQNTVINDYHIGSHKDKLSSKSLIHQLIINEKYQTAIELLHQLIDKSQQKLQMRQLSYWLLLMAITHYALEDKKHARSYFVESIEISRTRNYLRMYVDEGRLVYELLMFAVNEELTKEQHSFVSLLLKQCPDIGYKKQTLIEPLTAKEQAIVLQLGGGLPNKKVADVLNISEGTLKWHLHNIYLKFNVKNRTQALIAAKEHGYLHSLNSSE